MPSFKERVARIEGRAPRVAPSERDLADWYADDRPARARSGLSVFGTILFLPIGVALGAIAVLVGGILEANFIQEAAISLQTIPPQLSITTIAIALALSIVADRLVRGGIVWQLAVTAGFIGMMFGEEYLADLYPKVWVTLYSVDQYSADTFRALIG